MLPASRLEKGVRALVLAGLACISGFTVWSFHHADWPGFLATVALGGFLGVLAGGLVGVPLFPALAALTAFGGLFEGTWRGWSLYGWVGAALGAPVGLVAGS